MDYRLKAKPVNAFQWKGDRSAIPDWAYLVCRGFELNEATNPPGIIMHAVGSGYVKVPHGGWFVHYVEGDKDLCMARTDEAFRRMYEKNE